MPLDTKRGVKLHRQDQSRRPRLRAYLSWRWRCLAHPHYWLQEGYEKLRFPPGSPIRKRLREAWAFTDPCRHETGGDGGSNTTEEGLLKKPLSREQPPCPPSLSGGLFFHPLVGGHRLYPPDKGGQGGCFYQSKGVSPLLSKKGSFSTTPRWECLPTDEVSSNREGRDCSAESGTGVADIYKAATNPGLHSACRHEIGGEGGIRTPGAVTCTTDFESAALNRTRPPLRIGYLFSARLASPRGRCGGAPRKRRARACRSPRPLSLR